MGFCLLSQVLFEKVLSILYQVLSIKKFKIKNSNLKITYKNLKSFYKDATLTHSDWGGPFVLPILGEFGQF